jgi:hypothetical protein
LKPVLYPHPMRLTTRIWRSLVVLAGALLMVWPAFCNGYPLLYPDSMSYLRDGRPLAKMLLLHGPKGYLAMRSEIYSLGILPFHWGMGAWPIVGLQALLTSYVIWLVVRSLNGLSPDEMSSFPRRAALQFLILTGLLSLTTSLGWYVCFIMPDILGPVLYLSIYLLVFASETLSAGERWTVAAIAGWAMAAHSTHLMLAVGICALLGLLLMLRWPPLRARGYAVAAVAAIILLVAGVQTALHGYLYGKPSLYGNHMPYMMARVIADGPGRWYLQQHCSELHWAICDRVDSLPLTDDDFLWSDGGVWPSASAATQHRLLLEETPLVIASVRAYPRAQFQRSFANFSQEFTDFGLWDFFPNSWMQSEIDTVLPGSEATYLRTREAASTLPTAFFSAVQVWVVMVSAVAIAIGVPILWRRRRCRALGLVAVIVPTVVANALVTSVLSESDSRYQSRVIWLIPLVAGLIAVDCLNRSRQRETR